MTMGYFGLHLGALLTTFALASGQTQILNAPATILVVGFQQRSHLMQLHTVAELLVERGHRVYTALEHGHPGTINMERVGIRPIRFRLPKDVISLASTAFEKLITDMVFTDILPFKNPFIISELTVKTCAAMLGDDDFINEVKGIQFDLALTDRFFLSNCACLLPYILRIPFVTISALADPWLGGAPTLPSFVPGGVIEASDNMNLIEKLRNIAQVFMLSNNLGPFPGTWKSLLRQYAPEISSWQELVEKAEIHITTRDYILERPMPYMPKVIHVPGITQKPAGTLPSDLQQVIDQAEHGVILVSFGSITGDFPTEITNTFLEAFSRIKQTILWKFRGNMSDVRSDIPRNIHTLSWLPQNDILGQKNVKLFITHCGNNGQYESIYHAVPMIGFPLFGDQYRNAYRMQDRNYGIRMDILTFTAEQLIQNINTILSNASFRDNVNLASSIMRDRKMTAQETAVYWIEHVIKFGSDHLRSHAETMSWFEYFSIDVLCVLLAGFSCVFVLLSMLVRRVYRRVFGMSAPKVKIS